jgi:hypothetical protein
LERGSFAFETVSLSHSRALSPHPSEARRTKEETTKVKRGVELWAMGRIETMVESCLLSALLLSQRQKSQES